MPSGSIVSARKYLKAPIRCFWKSSSKGLLIVNESDLYRLMANSELPKAEIERLQVNIGVNILTLAQESYGAQPKGKGPAVGKSKQTGFNFGDPKQKRLFDTDKVSEYINNKENWHAIRESDPTKTPPIQLQLTFGKSTDPSGDLPVAQRVRMETTGRLDAGYRKIHTAADAASLLSQFSTAAQKNLITLAA